MVHQRRPWTATMHRTPCSVHTRSWLSASQYKQPLTAIPRGNHKNRTTRTQTQRCEKRPCSRTNKSRNRSRKQLTEKHLLPPTRTQQVLLCVLRHTACFLTKHLLLSPAKRQGSLSLCCGRLVRLKNLHFCNRTIVEFIKLERFQCSHSSSCSLRFLNSLRVEIGLGTGNPGVWRQEQLPSELASSWLLPSSYLA